MEETVKYKTLSAPASAEFKDRGSKFLAFAYPVSRLSEVKERLKALKKEHPRAVHHCYAFRLGTDRLNFRASDDGEPSGSAGRPILGQIDSAGLSNVLVVVVRYFGGTLLGVPGLIHAYKTATAEALRNGDTEDKWLEKKIHITFDYPEMSEVLYLLRQNEAIIYKQDLQLFCTIDAGIPIPYAEKCLIQLSDLRNTTAAEIQEDF